MAVTEDNAEVREDSEQARGNLSLGSTGRETARDLPSLAPTVTAALCELGLKDQVLQRVEKYLNVARTFRDRVPIRRPGSEIPKVLLEIGNEILIARAIAATTENLGREKDLIESLKLTLSEEIERRRVLVSLISIISSELDRRKVRKRGERRRVSQLVRYLRQLKDQLNTTQQKIKRVEESKRLMHVRRKGASYVAHRQVPSEKDTVVVPVTTLKKWAEDLGTGSTPETAQKLSESAWQELFRKVKPWKATGPDGIQGFWWKHLSTARKCFAPVVSREGPSERQVPLLRDGQTFFHATGAARAVAKLIRARSSKAHTMAWKGKAVVGCIIHGKRLGDELYGQ
ncbi:unnamed protein product [Cylicocyclus nassatus]|uniref:Uncharacterized protein n=1 Tax=Cylicocyclus nassatus TaxID=53992 RepID=A0AA36GTZ9_CYLNA|nr:unnamed protein product [Cylicocyclus nassatus]